MKYINKVIKRNTNPINKEMKKIHKQCNLVLKKIEKFSKNQTPEQKKKADKIRESFNQDIHDATEAFRLTKAQCMLHRLMQQLEIYEG